MANVTQGQIDNAIRGKGANQNGLNKPQIIKYLRHKGIKVDDNVTRRRLQVLLEETTISQQPSSTETLFPELYANGLTAYEWTSPDNDTLETGFFTFFGNNGSTKIYVDTNVLQKAVPALPSEFRNAKSLGHTTMVIPHIPFNTEFGWNYDMGVWVYKVGQKFYKAGLKHDLFVRRALDKSQSNQIESELYKYRLVDQARYESQIAAMGLKKILAKYVLNVATAESLTAGMLMKTLVDIPGNGAVVYGGFNVYDTDAKRKFIGVRTEGVYSHATAYQMAAGILDNSRAMVSIAVTGNAMVLPNDTEHMGQVYIGVGLRLPKGEEPYTIMTFKKNFCDGVSKLCDDWSSLHARPNNPAPFQITSMLADYIRLKTVKVACTVAQKVIVENASMLENMSLKTEPWDHLCQPSWILDKWIKSGNKSSKACNPYSDKDLNF